MYGPTFSMASSCIVCAVLRVDRWLSTSACSRGTCNRREHTLSLSLSLSPSLPFSLMCVAVTSGGRGRGLFGPHLLEFISNSSDGCHGARVEGTPAVGGGPGGGEGGARGEGQCVEQGKHSTEICTVGLEREEGSSDRDGSWV